MKLANHNSRLAAGLAVLYAAAINVQGAAALETPSKKSPSGTAPQPKIRLAQGAAPSAPRPPAKPPTALSSVGQLIATLNRAEAAMNGDALIYTYGQAVTNPLLARGALAHLMADYYGLRSKATSAMQASQAVDEAALRFSVMQAAQNQVTVQQNQIIIEQNQRIIALLEQIAKK